MSYYEHDKFVHPVPAGFVIPAGTPVYSEESAPHRVETFFIMQFDYQVDDSDEVKFYLTYDITQPKLPTKINSVIYDVRTTAEYGYPVAVFQGGNVWTAFTEPGKSKLIYTPDIRSFDTLATDRYADNEAKQREAAEA